jgi:AcrR family transcriptional regulator
MKPESMAQDHRQAILEAGLTILRKEGLASLTQPRIAAKTGLRQSHLTYYYPTRADLLAAVARRAMELQIDAVRSLLGSVSSTEEAAKTLAKAVCQLENTRVFAALNQVAEREPAGQALYGDLLRDFTAELAGFLGRLGLPPNPARVDLVHSLWVGVAQINLATGRPDAERRARAVFDLAFQLLSGGHASQ